MMFRRPASLALITASAVAALSLVAVEPAAASGRECPAGTTFVQPSAESVDELQYLDDMVVCADDDTWAAVLYNDSDMAWWFAGDATVDVFTTDDDSAIYHAAAATSDEWYPFFLPGDYAELSDIRTAAWYLDTAHSAGFLIGARLYDEVRTHSVSGAGFLAKRSKKVSKAVWECTENAIELGFDLTEDEVDGKLLLDTALDTGTSAFACSTAWDTAASSKAGKKAQLPRFPTVNRWLNAAGEASTLGDNLWALFKACALVCGPRG
jgi:hypothetical protein